jgi:hypothetical protein
MDHDTILNLTYGLAIIALSGVLVWGLKLISKELQSPGANSKTLLANALSEKTPRAPGAPGAAGQNTPDGSFSRTAGAIGAVGIAATFIGIGYWAIYELFFGSAADLTKISDLKVYFLAGSAMFLPYAFNQLSAIFKS